MWACIPRHTSILSTLPLAETPVSADPSCGGQRSGAGTGMHGDGLLDDKTILEELADGVAAVGVGEFVRLVRVHPNLALAAAGDGRRQALLSGKIDPVVRESHQLNGSKSILRY